MRSSDAEIPLAVADEPTRGRSPSLARGCLAVGAVAAAGAIARFGWSADTVAAVAFVAALAVLAAVDVEQRRIPNRIVLPASAAAALWQVGFHRGDVRDCLIAGLGAGLFFAVASLVTRGGVGMGDAKLALLIGLVLGRDVVTALIVATLAGGVAAGITLATGGRDARRRPMPYAPFLALGAVVALLFGSGSPLG